VRLNDATTPTYAELGIEKTTAYREQVVAQAFTEEEIIAMCAKARGEGQLPTFTHFLRLAKAKSLEDIPHLENPDNTYHTIVVDPPWPTEKINREVRPYQSGFDYKTMSLEEIKAFPIVRDSARAECHLYLWTTQKYLKESFEVMEAWGFQAIFTMVWNKRGGYQPFGLPQYTTEFVLFGRIGGLGFLETKGFSTSFEGERRGHSVKPIEFYEIVKRVSPAPRLDVFAREKHDGFDSWGAEIEMVAK
jgi:N6-adenosine-specific RNA methylase IME4